MFHAHKHDREKITPRMLFLSLVYIRHDCASSNLIYKSKNAFHQDDGMDVKQFSSY